MSTIEQISRMKAAFPDQRMPEDTVALYVEKLSDIEGTLLAAAADRLIEESTFMPKIAEVRTMAARLAGLLPPSPAEALAIVQRANVSEPIYRRDGSFAYTEYYWRWPEDVSKETIDFCERVIEKVGDPVNFSDDKARFGWETGFQKTAETVERELSIARLADLSQARLPSARAAAALPAAR